MSYSDINDVFYHRWFDETDSQRTFFSFEYSAACTLEFTYEAKIMVDATTVADLPYPEIVFNSDNNKFIIQKCNPNNIDNSSDLECVNNDTPYFKEYTVLVIGTLNDEDSTTASVSFDVTIGPDCDDDIISYSATIGHQDYTIGINSPVELPLSPAMTQAVPNCPVFCEVTSTSPFDFSPIWSFNDENGDMVIKTQQGTLNGATYNYAIECYSEYSTIMTPETPAVQAFTVGFSFEDCNSQINVPQDFMSDVVQYWGSAATDTNAISAYTYSATCSLDFTYSAFVNLNSQLVPVSSIKEISFDPISRVFTLEKCGSVASI